VATDPNKSRRGKAEAILSAIGSVPGGVIRVVSLEDAPGIANALSDGQGCDAVLEVGDCMRIQENTDVILSVMTGRWKQFSASIGI
jgi:hypothetical protein